MYHSSQLIAATNSRFSFGNDSRSVKLTLAPDVDMEVLLQQLQQERTDAKQTLSLHFEGIRGNDLLPILDIYLGEGIEQTPQQQNYIGSMALYGLGESSTPSANHDGGGQDRILNVTNSLSKIWERSRPQDKQFTITLVPSRSLPAGAELSMEHVALYLNMQ